MLSVTERQWLVPVFIIAVVVGAFYLVTNSTRPPGVLAQLPSGGDSRIIVVPVQLERDSYGIALVDTVGQKYSPRAAGCMTNCSTSITPLSQNLSR